MGVPQCLAVRSQAGAGEEQCKVPSAGMCRGSRQGCSLLQEGLQPQLLLHQESGAHGHSRGSCSVSSSVPHAPAALSRLCAAWAGCQHLQQPLLWRECGSPMDRDGDTCNARRAMASQSCCRVGPTTRHHRSSWAHSAPTRTPCPLHGTQGAGRAPGVRLRRSGLPLPRELSLSTSESCSLSTSSGCFFSLFLTAASSAFCLR